MAIEDAFADVPYPGNDNIAVTGPREDFLSAEELTKAFKGKSWKQIVQKKNSWLRSRYWALTHFTPSAYHFFLPAFLTKCVTDAGDLDLVPLWVVCGFIPPKSEHVKALMPFYLARKAKFNLNQRKTLIVFLKFLRDKFSNDDGFIENINQAISALKK